MDILTRYDLDNARILIKEERIFPVNRESMFNAGIYCIISAAEKYKKYRKVYEILEREFSSPKDIIKRKEELKEIVRKLRFPNRKLEFLQNFAAWWPKVDIPEKILEDIKEGRKNEFELRNRFAEEAPGISYKSVSFYDQVWI